MREFNQIITFIYNHPLAKKHKLKAFRRLLFWQIQCRLSYKLHRKKFINDIYFYAKKGLAGITGNIYVGLHEFEDMAFMMHFLRSEDVFYDVGANVGAYSLLASGVNKAKSIAFEPSKETMLLLKKNIYLNKLERLVDCINIGIGKEVSTLWFTNHEDTTNHFVGKEVEDAVMVETKPLDHFYEKLQPNLIKIDVEGFETDVLKGAKTILKSKELQAVIIELNGSGLRYGHHDEEIHQNLLDYGFSPYKYNPFTRSLFALESFGNINTIYVKDYDFVNKRIKSATSFNIFNENI